MISSVLIELFGCYCFLSVIMSGKFFLDGTELCAHKYSCHLTMVLNQDKYPRLYLLKRKHLEIAASGFYDDSLL